MIDKLDKTALRLALKAMTDAELAHVEQASRHWQGIGDKARREQKRRKAARKVTA